MATEFYRQFTNDKLAVKLNKSVVTWLVNMAAYIHDGFPNQRNIIMAFMFLFQMNSKLYRTQVLVWILL